MQMKNEKIVIALLFIIAIIILIININLLIKVIEKEKYLKTQKALGQEIDNSSKMYYENSSLNQVTNIGSLFTLKSCVDKYFSTLNGLWSNSDYIIDPYKYENVNKYNFEFNEYYSNYLLDLLSRQYKQENSLSINGIKDKFDHFYIQDMSIIDNAYKYDLNEAIVAYIVKGNCFCKDGSNKNGFMIMILVDNNEKTFEVYPEDYLIKHGLDKIKLNKKIAEITNVNKIEKNSYNTIPVEVLTNKKIVDYYFELYKFNIKYNVEGAYNMLDNYYKEQRFGTFENYKKYIDDNIGNLDGELNEYKISYHNGFKQFICIDENGYYFIFSPEDKCLDYHLTLDTYRIDSNEFIEKYYNLEKPGRVALNIQKIFDALNDKDYNYVYSKLADGFKNNYFKTQDDFEKYAKENFFEENEVDYLGYTKESEEYYSYMIKIKDKSSKDLKVVKIIMELQSGTNFVMSFNVD